MTFWFVGWLFSIRKTFPRAPSIPTTSLLSFAPWSPELCFLVGDFGACFVVFFCLGNCDVLFCLLLCFCSVGFCLLLVRFLRGLLLARLFGCFFAFCLGGFQKSRRLV